MSERATVLGRTEKSAEVEVRGCGDSRTEREGVLDGRNMRGAMRQMSAPAERSGVGQGEALSGPGSDEATHARHGEEKSIGLGSSVLHWRERTCSVHGNGCGPTRAQRVSTDRISTRLPTG
jgi:hypothetical protein